MKLNLRLVLAVCSILIVSCSLAFGQENPKTELEKADLVDISSLDPSILVDIRYATENNFTGQAVYSNAKCYLRRDIAQRLVKVQADLKKKGLGLKVYDCYRPFSVQKIFWRILPDARYVMKPVEKNGKPVKGSKHNRGAAVDLTLVDPDGNELEMPTPFDDFTKKAGRKCIGGTPAACKNRKNLENAMIKRGFRPISTEWWHFDGPGWGTYRLLDVPL